MLKKLLLLALVHGLAVAGAPPAALRAITADGLLGHIRTLASDEFEGRSPATHGETMTVDYLRRQFTALGLAPGNPDGSYVQRVPMLGLSAKPGLSFQVHGQTLPLKFTEDFVAWSPRRQSDVVVADSEVVFVGYGVVAPEYGWDDYKGMDLRGKTLLMLINDPPVPDPRRPGQLDPRMFKGEAMTYYGRWTYKYEIAARLGAAAAIIVHETKPAAYPYEVIRNSHARENFILQTNGEHPDYPAVPGWIRQERARQLLSAAGYDFDALKQAALAKDFKPVSIGALATLHVQNSWREVESDNVVAKIEGSDPKLKDEVVIYSAHWDHFGIDEHLPGPKAGQVFHGALDNASGVAALLEIAKAYRALPHPPKRSILFIATTAEERGLLGAQYYIRHPLYPLRKTVADINIDGINPWGRTRDVEIVGFGHSEMDTLFARQARTQRRSVLPESRPELGGFFRADQFEFAKAGVPVLYAKSRQNYIGKSEDYARQKVDDYIAHDYHKVSDTVHEDWDMRGAVEDVQLLFMSGYAIANSRHFPHWLPGSEFKAKRGAMLRGK